MIIRRLQTFLLLGFLCCAQVIALAQETADLPVKIRLLEDPDCSQRVEDVLLKGIPDIEDDLPEMEGCAWSRITISNPTASTAVRYLYFPNFWQSLECFILMDDGSIEKVLVGTHEGQELIKLQIPPGGEREVYVHYPSTDRVLAPFYSVEQLTEKEFSEIPFRSGVKFFMIGFLLFPFFFFLAQYFVERDRLNFAYLIFLLGAGLNLITIVEGTPYFMYTPKTMMAVFPVQVLTRVFVVSVLLCLGGLVKYIHYLLEVKKWNPRLNKVGNWLLWGYLGISLVPFLFVSLFTFESYSSYLIFLRLGALVLVLYILTTIVWAVFRHIKFSVILILAFAPFVLGALYYALSFVLRGSYSENSHEALLLIAGFFLTLLLFGIILGVRNKLVKSEKVRLEQRAHQLRELDEFKSRFYTNFTHEFRTPLTVISGVASQIDGHEKEKTLIRRNSKRLLDTVNQLLDLSRLETRSLAVNHRQGDVINFLQYLTESCASLAEHKNLNLAFFSPADSLVMDYDADKLQQILINLLSNAIKFTPEYGTVKVIADSQSIEGKSMLQIQVKDTGYGISPDHLPHIFDRFYQADNSDTRQEEGSGIGLALVKELVSLLGGSIDVTSEPDRGTTFEVLLPITRKAEYAEFEIPDSAIVEMEFADADQQESHYEGDRAQVLLIEDNADVRAYIVSCLEEEFDVHTARNGKLGVDLAFEVIPDVVISDVMMPEMDGFEVCSTLKGDRRTSHIPVLLLTAKATQQDRVTGLKHGADAYLTKPFDKEELMIRLANLTAISHQLRNNLSGDDPLINTDDHLSRQESAFIEEVNEIISTHMENQDFDTQMLCREIAMSRTQLHRKLKALTGNSTAYFIRMRRLRKAEELLKNTDLTVGEISEQVGYKDFSHFSRSFAQEFGRTPTESRQEAEH